MSFPEHDKIDTELFHVLSQYNHFLMGRADVPAFEATRMLFEFFGTTPEAIRKEQLQMQEGFKINLTRNTTTPTINDLV